jgi:hypothetical protein
MLVHIGMPGTFSRTSPAKRDAGCELRLDELALPRFVGARQYGPGGCTDCDAVKIEADASDQTLNFSFGHARIRASGADLNAVETCIDSLADLQRMRRFDGMRPQHGSNG